MAARGFGYFLASQAASTLYLRAVLADQDRRSRARERFILAEMRFLVREAARAGEKTAAADPGLSTNVSAAAAPPKWVDIGDHVCETTNL